MTSCLSGSSYVEVDLAGSSILLAADNVAVGGEAEVLFVLRQGNRLPVAGLGVFVESDTCAAAGTAVTDGSGRARVVVRGCPSGEQALRSGFSYHDFRAGFATVRYLNVYPSPNGASVVAGTPLTLSSLHPDAADADAPAAVSDLHLVSSDPQATLPSLAQGEGGLGQIQSRLGLVLRTPGAQQVSLVDGAGRVLSTTTFVVVADDRASLQLQLPEGIVAGEPFVARLEARDSAGALEPRFAGSVSVLGDDPNVVPPAWGPFVGGVAPASG